ncbi:MAG: Uma2 family endonuclease [Candidatus Kapabacteria bacterium]|nr:Uma2 family endonuclease [Candidatus Kapabacteria bacterium]
MTALLEASPDVLPIVTERTERITTNDFRAMEFDDTDTFYYELLNGELVAKSAPSPLHQRISRNIFRALDNFVIANNLGEVLYAPLDVFLDEYNATQPNVLFLSREKQHLVTPDGVQGAPDLVIEIISPSSMKRDRGDKMKLYERCGIGEYWLVDARTRSVEVYVNGLVNGVQDYELRDVFMETASESAAPILVRSVVLNDFTMPLTAVFAGVE